MLKEPRAERVISLTRHPQRLLAIGALTSFALVPVLWGLVHAFESPLDAAVRDWMARFTHPLPPGIDVLAAAVSFLGSPAGAAVTVTALAGLAYRTYGLRGVATVIGAAGVVIASTLLKDAFGVTPIEAASRRYPVATFPSGHVAYATAVFGLATLAALARRRRTLALAFAAVVVLMGPVRVIEGAHWPTDVLAGYALGAGWLLGVLWLRATVRPRAPQPAG